MPDHKTTSPRHARQRKVLEYLNANAKDGEIRLQLKDVMYVAGYNNLGGARYLLMRMQEEGYIKFEREPGIRVTLCGDPEPDNLGG